MDMNRYLIVVFCVITGCTAAVPMADAQELVLDNQRFVAWCAEHAQNIEKSYAEPILVEIKTIESTEICCVNATEPLLLKNLPKFPVAKTIKLVNNFVEESQSVLLRLSVDSNIPVAVTVRGSNRIRAPGWNV